MKAIYGKKLHSIKAEFQRHPAVIQMERLLSSRRFWAFISMAGLLVLLLMVIITVVMFAFWAINVDFSVFDLSPLL